MLQLASKNTPTFKEHLHDLSCNSKERHIQAVRIILLLNLSQTHYLYFKHIIDGKENEMFRCWEKKVVFFNKWIDMILKSCNYNKYNYVYQMTDLL